MSQGGVFQFDKSELGLLREALDGGRPTSDADQHQFVSDDSK